MRLGSHALLALALVGIFSGSAGAQKRASTRWQEIGKTSQGNPVFIDPASVKKAAGIVTASIRVTFVKPVTTPRGSVTSARAIAMFDCAKKLIASKQNTLFIDESKGQVFQKTVNAEPGYGPAIGGSFADVAMKHFCAS